MVHADKTAGTRADSSGVTRRQALRGIGGAAAAGLTAGLAGCSGGGGGGADQEVYIVAFHWGFRLITPDGDVKQSMSVGGGDSVKVYGVNLEPIAEGGDIDIPDAVMSAAQDGYEDWEHSSLERIAPELGMSEADLEEELESAEEQYKDHGMAVMDADGNQAVSQDLPGDMSSPEEETFTADSGPYEVVCTQFCGVGHSEMVLEDAITTS